MVGSNASPDWLDAFCWRCGSEDARMDGDGRLLCVPCRGELFGAMGFSANALVISRGAYWESHVLEQCWRCLSNEVDVDDDLGLCLDCRDALTRSPDQRLQAV